MLLRLSLCLVLTASSACILPPSPKDYLAVGFRSPQQAFKSFQTAMAGKQLDLEYRCLGSKFRLANGIDGMTYRLGRKQLLSENPFMRLISQAEVTGCELYGPERCRLTVQYKKFGANESFYVFMQREDFFEAWSGDQSAFFNFDSFESQVIADEEDPSILYAVVQAPPGVDPAQLSELNWGREWRIAGFEPVPEPISTP